MLPRICIAVSLGSGDSTISSKASIKSLRSSWAVLWLISLLKMDMGGV
jgi:hypothetical protein